MTQQGGKLTASGVSDPQRPACGGGIVPAPPRSSSHNGHYVNDDAPSGAVGAGGRESLNRLPLRLLGGGAESDSNRKEDSEFALPGPSNQPGPGPRSRSMARRGNRNGSRSRSRTTEARKKEEDGRDRSQVKKGKEESQVAPTTATRGTDPTSTNEETESPRKPETCGWKELGSGRSSREGSPNPMSVCSVSSKRTREEDEEDDSGETQSMSPSLGSIKRRKDGRKETRGRKAKDPSHEGEFTWEKMEERRKKEEERRQEEVADWVRDSDSKAKTKRAEVADRNALKKMDEWREAPTASLTQAGIKAVEKIKKVASASKNLKGSFVGDLWRAAEDLAALNLIMARRVQPLEEGEGSRGMTSEMEDLRREVSALRTSNALLQGQVKSLREAVARGEEERAPPEIEMEEVPRKRRKKKGGSPTPAIGSSSSSDEEWTEELTPLQRETGRRAREEVQRDLREGTLPPAIRPPILGRSRVMETDGVPPAHAEVLPSRPIAEQAAPTPHDGGMGTRPGGGWGLEEVVQAVVKTLVASGLIPSPGPTQAAPVKGPAKVPEEPRNKEEGGKKSSPLPPQPQAAQSAVEGQGGKKKGKKKKKKKGRKRNEGAVAPVPAPRGGKEPQPAGPTAVEGERPRPVQPTWAEVTKRKRAAGAATGGGQTPLPKNVPQPPKGKGGKAPLPRGPRGAAVTLTCPEGRYSQVLTEARGAIKLEELGISGIRARRAVTGALVLEIPGQEGSAKAEALRRKMADLFAGREDVRVSRPVRRSELRIRDLDDSATAEDVKAAVAGVGGSLIEEVQTGPVRKGPNGLGTVWVRCPLAAARKVVAGGRLTVGWTAARVEALTVRPLQCYKCLKEGHVRAQCPSEVDRSGQCYRCGSTGHKAGQCGETARCPVCRDANLPSDHRLGGRACKGVKVGAKGKKVARPLVDGREKGAGTPGGAKKAPAREERGDEPPKEQRKRRGADTPMEVCLEETGAPKTQ